MTFDEWLNDAEPAIIGNQYKDYHLNFAKMVWSAATIAERERCARICEGLPHSDNYTCAEEIRVSE